MVDGRARTLAAGTSSSTVGFVIVDLTNRSSSTWRGAEQEAEEHGLNVLLANVDMRPAKQDSYLQLFEEERVAGLLVAPLPDMADAPLQRPGGGPTVVLNVDFAGNRCSGRASSRCPGGSDGPTSRAA